MGTGASTAANKKSFMRAAESQGFYESVMGAKSNEEKLAVFAKIKAELARCFVPFMLL